jgi:hypothetical protein
VRTPYVLGALAAASLCSGQSVEAGGADGVSCSGNIYVYHNPYNPPRVARAYRYPPYWVPPVYWHVYLTGPSPAYDNQRFRYLHSRYIFP